MPLTNDVAPGVYPDMTEHGFATDAWPALYEQVMTPDILVLAGPIWLGENSPSPSRSSSGSTAAPASSTPKASTPISDGSAGV
ncbi:hypothetical protein QF032_003230 [Streptomyces achromogenes]|nr:hypothetical protein [Streptomyces achromogenes]